VVLNVADEACSVTSYSDDDSSVHQKADDVTDDVIDDVADSKMSAITCNLETKELWEKFHQLGTEMIITKSGRYLLHPLYFFRCPIFFACNIAFSFEFSRQQAYQSLHFRNTLATLHLTIQLNLNRMYECVTSYENGLKDATYASK